MLSAVRPSLEYGSEIWDCNKSQARTLESILLGGAIGCSSPKHRDQGPIAGVGGRVDKLGKVFRDLEGAVGAVPSQRHSPQAQHLLGRLNISADFMSWHLQDRTDRMLYPAIVRVINQPWGPLDISVDYKSAIGYSPSKSDCCCA